MNRFTVLSAAAACLLAGTPGSPAAGRERADLAFNSWGNGGDAFPADFVASVPARPR